ncbi:hypothetical protein LA080_013113 [Diaporthe eres]|nr:hypothetical protein LA080_013113 [Diaporthe eres]
MPVITTTVVHPLETSANDLNLQPGQQIAGTARISSGFHYDSTPNSHPFLARYLLFRCSGPVHLSFPLDKDRLSWSKTQDNMTDQADVPLLQAGLPDPGKIPTSPLALEMLSTIYLTAAVAYITYGLRMYSKIASRQTGLEDWLMTAAVILSVGFMSVQYRYLKYNYAGLKQSEFPATMMPASLFSTWLSQLLYSPILGLVKSSTLVFMLRIAGHMRNIKRSIHVINAINICLTIATVVTTIFATIPISGYWDPKHEVQHEINHAGFIMATSCLTILTDILVLAMPFWAFMKTQLPLTTKLGVVMIFMTGGLVTAFGIVRFCVLAEQYFEPPPTRLMDTWGPSYAAFETNLAITTACLPALRPLFREWFPNTFGLSNIEESRASEGRSHYTGVGSGNERSIRMEDLSHKRGNARWGGNSTTGTTAPMMESAGIRRTTDGSSPKSYGPSTTFQGSEAGDQGKNRQAWIKRTCRHMRKLVQIPITIRHMMSPGGRYILDAQHDEISQP